MVKFNVSAVVGVMGPHQPLFRDSVRNGITAPVAGLIVGIGDSSGYQGSHVLCPPLRLKHSGKALNNSKYLARYLLTPRL
jgi:hypothetical protein